jgi:hypothetical protein
MDNHSVHKTKVVREIYDDQFKQIFLRPQNCETSHQESVEHHQVAMAEGFVHNNNRKKQENISDALDYIQGIADGQGVDEMKKVAHCNHKANSLTLRGHKV